MMDDRKARGEDIGQRVGNTYMINDALGREAFFRRDYKTAAEYLMKAVDPPPGKYVEGPICCFGPNLWLAKSLLRAGYRDDVLRFLQACRKSVWISDTEMLDQWIADLISGNEPKFERNADIHF